MQGSDALATFQIGSFKPKNKVMLAPMSDYTDRSFRKLALSYDAGLVFTEMIHATWLIQRNPKTLDIAKVDGGPTVYQLVGTDIADMCNAAKMLEAKGAPLIDLNMGCPDADLKAMGAGVYLSTDIDKCKRMAKAVVNAVKVPVTAKIRLGINQVTINCRKLGLALEGAGIAAITLHPRTGNQKLTGPSYWYYIKELKQALHIPVIGNGDIMCLEDAKFMLKSTKCDAVMIGRAALRTPYIFKQVASYLAGGKILPEQTFEERANMVLDHAEMLVNDKGHSLGMQWVRRFLPFFMGDFKRPPDIGKFAKGIIQLSDLKKALEHIRGMNRPEAKSRR
jgi:tRNA-dihydrouridine synthase B